MDDARVIIINLISVNEAIEVFLLILSGFSIMMCFRIFKAKQKCVSKYVFNNEDLIIC